MGNGEILYIFIEADLWLILFLKGEISGGMGYVPIHVFVIYSRSVSGAPCVRGVHSSNEHCVAAYYPISTRFPAFFHR